MIDGTDTVDGGMQIIGFIICQADHFQSVYIAVEICLGIAIYIGMRYITVDSTGGTAQEIDTVIAVGIDYGNTNGILEGQVAQTDRNLESQGIVLHIVVDDNIVTVFDILLQIIQLAVLNFCGPAGCFLVSPLGTAVGIVQNIGGGLRSLYSDLSQTGNSKAYGSQREQCDKFFKSLHKKTS